MSAAGKVCTGFSKPYVAIYTNNGGNVTYSKGQILARGVSVSIEPEVADDNTFYADNIAAETSPGVFTGGNVILTVDGLLQEAEQLIIGLPMPEEITVGESEKVEVLAYGVGIGFIVRYQSDGVESFSPVVLTKARFQTPSSDAETQEEEINWQTQELTATLMRDDTPNHNWKKVAADQSTEDGAETVLKAMLGVQNV